MTTEQAEPRERCRYTIEGPEGTPRGASRRKVWWRRPCLRWAQPGTTRCWQHQVGS